MFNKKAVLSQGKCDAAVLFSKMAAGCHLDLIELDIASFDQPTLKTLS